MRRTELLYEIGKIRCEEAYEGWQSGRITWEVTARVFGECDRRFWRHMARFEEDGLDGLMGRRQSQARQGHIAIAIEIWQSFKSCVVWHIMPGWPLLQAGQQAAA